jgi:transketolase
VPTVKPLDVDAVVEAAARTGHVIVVEEHSILGGLGSVVAETLSARLPTHVDRIGIRDTWVESGANAALLDAYGLSAERVAEQVRELFRRG